MEVTMAELQGWVTLIGTMLALGLSAWNFIQAPSKKNGEKIATLERDLMRKIDALDDQLDEAGGKISTLETVVKQMPDREMVHRLEVGMERLSGRLETLNGKLEPVEHLGRRLQEILLQQRAS